MRTPSANVVVNTGHPAGSLISKIRRADANDGECGRNPSATLALGERNARLRRSGTHAIITTTTQLLPR